VPLGETNVPFQVIEPNIDPLTRYQVGDTVTAVGSLTCFAVDQTTVIGEVTDTQAVTIVSG
jgi:hypothetical protein